MTAVLNPVNRLYLDTAPLIYYIEANPNYLAKMQLVIDLIEKKPIEAFSSVITLTEVLNHPLKQGDTKLAQNYRDILLNNENFQLLNVNSKIAEAAAEFRARYKLRSPDAIHIATAIEWSCDAFLTNDKGLTRVTEIQVLLVEDL
jgi:predicted nucleic acid-binding protein